MALHKEYFRTRNGFATAKGNVSSEWPNLSIFSRKRRSEDEAAVPMKRQMTDSEFRAGIYLLHLICSNNRYTQFFDFHCISLFLRCQE